MNFSLGELDGIGLNGKYVYYQRLLKNKNEEYRKLGITMRQSLLDFSEIASDPKNISAYFAQMARREFAKEEKMLREYFDADKLNYYLEDKNAAKKIIDTVNAVLGIKDVYERNLQVLLNNNGQKNLITWFPTYFNRAFDAAWSDEGSQVDGIILPKLNALMEERIKEEEPTDEAGFRKAVSAVINENIDEIVRYALILMFDAGVETHVDQQYQTAYRELLAATKKNSAASRQYIADIKQVYELDKITDILMENFDPEAQAKDFKAKASKVKGKVGANIHSRGGYNLENYLTFVINEAFKSGLKTGGNIQKVEAHSSGSTGQKADVIINIGLNTSAIEKWLESSTFGTREKDRAALTELQRKLKNFQDGFIVYTNVKNYTVNSDFERRGGFSAGEAIKLRTFAGISKQIIPDGKKFTIALMNTIPGALNDKNYGQVKTALARSIAAFLFDDFSTIGNDIKQGANALHLFSLNGIYVPLSWFFYQLSLSFSNAEQKINSNGLVRITIKEPSEIEFPTQAHQIAWQKKNGGQSAWRYQADEALDSTTITVHFLGAIKELLKDLQMG